LKLFGTPDYNELMPMRVRVVLACLFVLIAGVIGWQVARLREPAYHDLPLSAWLARYSPERDSPETDEALRAMGTNAIPTLLENLRARDSRLRLTVPALGIRYTPAEVRHARAQKGFTALGANASNAVPDITAIYERDLSSSSRHAAANALVEIGPAAKGAIPALISSAASTNSEVRAFAVYTLGRMALEPERVNPVLIRALQDPDREVRYDAAFGLGALAFMGGDAKCAVPALVQTLKDSYGTARAAAAMVVPALIEALRDPAVFGRVQAASALGQFGTNGGAAVAALTELLKDERPEVREAAAKALRAIQPDATSTKR
jgi:HEAT repeat protein